MTIYNVEIVNWFLNTDYDIFDIVVNTWDNLIPIIWQRFQQRNPNKDPSNYYINSITLGSNCQYCRRYHNLSCNCLDRSNSVIEEL